MRPWLRLTLITMTVGGGFNGFVQTFWALINPENQQPVYIFIMIAFLALYAFVTASGLLFSQNPQRTLPLRLALWLQVPWISSSIITYQFTSGFHFSIGLSAGHLSAESWLGSGWEFYLFSEIPWGFGINLFAVLVLVLLTRSMKKPIVALSPTIPADSWPHTFVEEIDRIVQRHLAQAKVHDQSVHLYSQPDGSVAITVNGRVFQDVNTIEETAIRDIVQESINEWQENN